MIKINEFDQEFTKCLPETCSILKSAGLVVHPSITQITLHGSRGLANTYRSDSDIDLSLLVSFSFPPAIDQNLGRQLQEVNDVTSCNWKSPVELDLAVIFPLHPCNFACFQTTKYDPSFCFQGGVDCFGIYKVQKGFSGFALNAGIRVELMYPCITIWKTVLHH